MLREKAPLAALAGGALWVVAVIVLGAALIRNDGEFLMTCPSDGSCNWAAAVPKWVTAAGMGMGLLSFLLVGVSLLGFLQWEFTGWTRGGLWLMVVGLPLIFALGMGLTFFVPGLLLFAIGLRRTEHWKGPTLMLGALVATFFVAEPIDDPGDKSVVLMVAVTVVMTLIGVGWGLLGISTGRDGGVSAG